MAWLVVAIAVVGAVLNVNKWRQWFLLWLVSNSYWCVIAGGQKRWAEATLFAFFFALSLVGMVGWRKQRVPKTKPLPNIRPDAIHPMPKVKPARAESKERISCIEYLTSSLETTKAQRNEYFVVLKQLIEVERELKEGATRIRVSNLFKQAREIVGRHRIPEIER